MSKCFLCDNLAAENHEFFYGRGIRDIAIEYNLKIPLCRVCHKLAHAHKRIGQKQICARLKLPYHQISVIMRKVTRDWTEYDKKVMERVKVNMQKKHKQWGV